MRLTGPYYRITVDHGTMYVPEVTLPDLRTVVSKLCEYVEVKPEEDLHVIVATEGQVTGSMWPSSADAWHVVIRITTDGLSLPYWLSGQEMRELNADLRKLAMLTARALKWTV